MATVTPNFNWPVPTSTDLVRDGATAIEALGDSIDASMVDLKGGTTGQVLSKTSNTDMDFTWTSPNPGDITAVTAGTGITGGGTSGAVTVSFDQANFGGGQFAAGKNKIINGNLNVNQRAFTSTTANATFTFDRFVTRITGDGTATYSAQTFTPGAAPVAGYESTNYVQIVTASQTTSAVRTTFRQNIESVTTFAGQTVTLSFFAKAASGTPKIAGLLTQNFGSGGSTFVDNPMGAVTISTDWARYSLTITLPSISGKTLGAGNYLLADLGVSAGSDLATQYSSIGIQNNTFSIWGIQLEAGNQMTPFQTATGTLQGELAACQRYYQRQLVGTGRFGLGFSSSTTAGKFVIPLPVSMRVPATSIEYGGTIIWYDGVGGASVATLTLENPTAVTVGLGMTGSSGLTQYRPIGLTGNSSDAYLAFNAEL